MQSSRPSPAHPPQTVTAFPNHLVLTNSSAGEGGPISLTFWPTLSVFESRESRQFAYPLERKGGIGGCLFSFERHNTKGEHSCRPHKKAYHPSPRPDILESSLFPTVHKKRSLHHGSHTSPNVPQSTWTRSALP